MHCGLPAGIGRQATQVPWIQAHYSECRPIGCIVSLPDTCGLADFERLEFVSSRVYMGNGATLPPHSHNALQSYQQASLSLTLSVFPSPRSWLRPLLETQQ